VLSLLDEGLSREGTAQELGIKNETFRKAINEKTRNKNK
jgi:hypothetical protein